MNGINLIGGSLVTVGAPASSQLLRNVNTNMATARHSGMDTGIQRPGMANGDLSRHRPHKNYRLRRKQRLP